MKLVWEYDLPTNEESDDYHFESPIFVMETAGKLYFISEYICPNEMPRTRLKLYEIDSVSGVSNVVDIPDDYHVIPSKFIFINYKDKLIIYTGAFWLYDGKSVAQIFNNVTPAKIGAYCVYENLLIFSNCCKPDTWCSPIVLWCCDLDSFEVAWSIHISNSKPYRCGDLTVFEQTIACYGRDALLFIDPKDGSVINEIKISRIDMLYHPIRTADGKLLLGYTNWSNAGILKYDVNTSKVIWRHKRKFEGPQTNCKLYTFENLVYWVKNDTELICLNSDTGEEMFARRASPWIYTDLNFLGDRILYGTAGANGYFNCIDARSGAKYYSVFLKNGCAYYDLYKDTVILGDFSKTMMQISLNDGRILQSLSVDGEVVGDIHVYDNAVYTVIWGNQEKDIRLVKINL